MLGIPSFKPKFHNNAESFKNEFDKTLSELMGKKIEKFWLMWNIKKDEWLADGPVVLEIDEKRFEFTAYQLDEFSMTINSFELSEKLDWYGGGDEIPLAWKENPKAELRNSLNRTIKGINILTYDFYEENNESEYVLIGVEFVLEKESESDKENFFSIYNGLDQNEINNTELEVKNQIKRMEITSYKS
ncbi:hypothetical protein POV27_05085 [Aureisphaera galaxeae]|uniref:hypothetical protein n=1 Tax=Aureisphaera galaxeae TaxID=1538023 RepID=UPI0023509AAC|nr:hypothetical protein [Aureisphaera galaxeae]MDC8003413.1 hypothetical protein [Aureisphaera galaxeae]